MTQLSPAVLSVAPTFEGMVRQFAGDLAHCVLCKQWIRKSCGFIFGPRVSYVACESCWLANPEGIEPGTGLEPAERQGADFMLAKLPPSLAIIIGRNAKGEPGLAMVKVTEVEGFFCELYRIIAEREAMN